MSRLASQEAAILADTTPFCRFAESGISEVVVDYLHGRLYITPDVEGELDHRARQAEHADLTRIGEREPPYVATPRVTLTDLERQRAAALAEGWRKRQERTTGAVRDARANLGEAATIVAGQRLGYTLLLDEGGARKYAVAKGLTVITTQDIVTEICAAGLIGAKRAYLLYERVYSGATRAAFDAEVAAARGLLGR